MKNEVGAFILRITLGFLFLVHGLAKFQSGIENVVGMFNKLGLPGFMAYGVALLEVVGGAALIIGLGTRIVSSLFALLMVGAILKVKLDAGLMGNGQMAGYELDLVLFAIALYLAISGSKLYSVDKIISNEAEGKTNEAEGKTKTM